MVEVSEEDMRNLAARHQEFQRQAEGLRQQMNMVQASITSCDQTIEPSTSLKPFQLKVRLPKRWYLLIWFIRLRRNKKCRQGYCGP